MIRINKDLNAQYVLQFILCRVGVAWHFCVWPLFYFCLFLFIYLLFYCHLFVYSCGNGMSQCTQ